MLFWNKLFGIDTVVAPTQDYLDYRVEEIKGGTNSSLEDCDSLCTVYSCVKICLYDG